MTESEGGSSPSSFLRPPSFFLPSFRRPSSASKAPLISREAGTDRFLLPLCLTGSLTRSCPSSWSRFPSSSSRLRSFRPSPRTSPLLPFNSQPSTFQLPFPPTRQSPPSNSRTQSSETQLWLSSEKRRRKVLRRSRSSRVGPSSCCSSSSSESRSLEVFEHPSLQRDGEG